MPSVASPPSSREWARSLFALGVFVALYLAYWLVYRWSPEFHSRWLGFPGPRGAEDKIVEWLGFLGFLGAGVFTLLVLRFRSTLPHRLILPYLLGVGIFYLLCAGEEISWGQRIFGWETPEEYAKINEQGETNLHNLRDLPIHPKDVVSWWMKLFGIGFPIGFYFAFKRRDHFLRRCVAPIHTVPLFIFIEIFNLLEKPLATMARNLPDRAIWRLIKTQHEEIVEMYWGLAVAFAAVGIYLTWKRARPGLA